jgi:hypothetical protein
MQIIITEINGTDSKNFDKHLYLSLNYHKFCIYCNINTHNIDQCPLKYCNHCNEFGHTVMYCDKNCIDLIYCQCECYTDINCKCFSN